MSERRNNRMKKLLIILITVMLMFTLTACGNEEIEIGIEDSRTMEYFLQAFEDAGYELIDIEEASLEVMQRTGAVNTVEFELMLKEERFTVVLRQFDNEDVLFQQYEHRAFLSEIGMGAVIRNGMFLITMFPENQELLEFFITIR